MSVCLVSYSKDYLENILNAMSMCYGKTCTAKGLQRSIEAGHLSLLEHSMVTFEIECSLAVLGQITRHRHLSFTVKSSRGSHFPMDYDISDDIIGLNRTLFVEAIEKCNDVYCQLLENGVPKQHSALVIPKVFKTKLYVSGNLRAWYEYLPKRLCKRALPEHRMIAERIHSELSVVMPEIFSDVKAPCSTCKESSCKF